MAKLYSEKELNNKAKGAFDRNPEAQMLYATSDGQFFLEANKNYAITHSHNMNPSNPLKIYEIRKGDLNEKSLAEAKALAEAEAKTLAEAEAKALVEAEAKALAEAEAKALAEATKNKKGSQNKKK